MFDCSKIRGFNYQPSYGSTSLENWLYYSPDTAELELRRGKEYFPGFNTVRYWLSWDAYVRHPKKFIDNFEKSLCIADRLGLKVVACLFNRWHCPYDNGGVYLDNILFPSAWCYYRPQYQEYADDITQRFSQDPRILIWDICNEPFTYWDPIDEEAIPFIPRELEWLTELYHTIKKNDGRTPVGVSIHGRHAREGLERIEPISDILLVHPYFKCTENTVYDETLRNNYLANVQLNVDFAKEKNKQLLVTETCWGANSDSARAEIVRYTLEVLSQHRVGFLAHALHYSNIADLHDESDGLACGAGNMAFITKDGTLRPGHGIFNDY